MYRGYDDVQYCIVSNSADGEVGVVDWFNIKPSDRTLRQYPKNKGYNVERVYDDKRGAMIKREIRDIINCTT